jgi:hypothetical protein
VVAQCVVVVVVVVAAVVAVRGAAITLQDVLHSCREALAPMRPCNWQAALLQGWSALESEG